MGAPRLIMDANNHAVERLTVLAPGEAETLAAIAERIFPTTDTPGAVKIGSLRYIDIALAGDYATNGLVDDWIDMAEQRV